MALNSGVKEATDAIVLQNLPLLSNGKFWKIYKDIVQCRLKKVDSKLFLSFEYRPQMFYSIARQKCKLVFSTLFSNLSNLLST